MWHTEEHWRLTRYLRSPVVDVGEGDAVCHKAVRVPPDYLSIFANGALRTVCVNELDGAGPAADLLRPLAEGGHLIACSVSPGGMKGLRSAAKISVCEDGPFTIVRKTGKGTGQTPWPARSQAGDGRRRVLIIRYGAVGDHLMLTPLLDYYRSEGYHVTLNCTETGGKVFRGDPRIDDLWVQEGGIVPADDRIRAYWERIGKEYDEVVNLSESVERDMLALEGTPEFNAPAERRRATGGRMTYFDRQFEAAGLAGRGRLPSIWLSESERRWAADEAMRIRKRIGRSMLVLWNPVGSSFHKIYPWMFDVFNIVRHNGDDIGFLVVSDGQGGYLAGSEYSDVAFNAGGRYDIRRSIAMHSAVDAVVSVETWSMIAAFAFDAPLVGLLSHSSRSNYPARGQDILLAPSVADCPCWPCHQLHYTRASCPRGVHCRDATLCMDSIPPSDVYDALLSIYRRRSADVRHAC